MVCMTEGALVTAWSQHVADMTEDALATAHSPHVMWRKISPHMVDMTEYVLAEKATDSTTNGIYDLVSTATAENCDKVVSWGSSEGAVALWL